MVILGPLPFLCYACFMGRHRHHSIPYTPPTINRPFEPKEESLTIPMQPKAAEQEANVVTTAASLDPNKQRVWIVQEERRVALGALVTVAKGKVIKKADIAEKLRQQNVPLEEVYI